MLHYLQQEGGSMNPTMVDITIALFMVALSTVLVIGYLKYLNAGSKRRMISMMERVGLDPETATLDDPQIKNIINDVRKRCRKCPSEDVCERWLAGEIDGENNFCPNAQVFVQLTRNTKSIA